MITLLGAVFIASLFGSLHCVGMCGPFALFAGAAARNQGPSDRSRLSLAPMIGYNVGRLATYLTAGFFAGLFGMAIDFGGRLAGWQQTATYFCGGMMIATALFSLARQFGWIRTSPTGSSRLAAFLHCVFQHIKAVSPFRRSLAIGFFTTWMPCGWLYVFVLAAGGTASPIGGMTLMFVFWLGTVPLLAALVMGSAWLARRPKWNLQPSIAVLGLVVGLMTIASRGTVDLSRVSSRGPTGLNQSLQHVQNVDEIELPCCVGDQ